MRTLFRDLQPENAVWDATGFAKKKQKTNACLTLLLMPINKTSTELSDDLYYILVTQWANSDLVKNTPGLFNYSFRRAGFEKIDFCECKVWSLKICFLHFV